MSENENATTTTQPGPQHEPLRRELRSRMVAGVCGGLGRHLNVDPVVFRVLFAVLTFFGGVGLLAYAAAWLLIAADQEGESEAQKLLSGRSTLAAVAVTVVLVLGFMTAARTAVDGFTSAVPLLVVAAAIVAVLAWRDEHRPPNPPGQPPGTPGDAMTGGAPAPEQDPQPWWQRPVPTYPGPRFAQPFGHGDPAAPAQATAIHPAAVPALRQRRVGGLVLAAASIAAGILGVLAAAGVIHIGWTAGFALAVMALGAGMMIGGLVGRARRLIPVALVLAVPMIAASALNVPLHGQTGKVAWSASSARAVASPYEMATGVGTLDLSTLDPMGGTVQVVAHVGGGKLVVTVPADVAVRVTAHVGFGRIDVPDRETISGIDLTKTYDIQVAGASKGTIVLDLRVGAGDLEVQHG